MTIDATLEFFRILSLIYSNVVHANYVTERDGRVGLCETIIA